MKSFGSTLSAITITPTLCKSAKLDPSCWDRVLKKKHFFIVLICAVMVFSINITTTQQQQFVFHQFCPSFTVVQFDWCEVGLCPAWGRNGLTYQPRQARLCIFKHHLTGGGWCRICPMCRHTNTQEKTCVFVKHVFSNWLNSREIFGNFEWQELKQCNVRCNANHVVKNKDHPNTTHTLKGSANV